MGNTEDSVYAAIRKEKAMEEKEVVLRIRHLSKEYRLGVIGSGHFRGIFRAGGRKNVADQIRTSGSDAGNIQEKRVFMH